MRRLLVYIALVIVAGCGQEDPDFSELVELVQPLNGVPQDGYPNYEERLMLMAINRARSDPNNVALETARPCSNNYSASNPLVHKHDGSRAARFHCLNSTLNGGGLSHNSYCNLRSDIGTSGCDGHRSCACASDEHFSCQILGGHGTDPWDRCDYFGFDANNEVGAAGYLNGWEAVKGWITECPGDVSGEGHRRVLADADRLHTGIGLGFSDGGSCYNTFFFGDTSNAAEPNPILPAGCHRSETGNSNTSFQFYLNYFDPGGAPQRVDLVLDGSCHSMTREIGTNSRGTWKVDRQVGAGCHQYWFLVRASDWTRVAYPEAGSWGVGDCTAYSATAIEADCEVCIPGQTRPCGIGQCAGQEVCNSAGSWDPCDGPPPAPSESCNGLDDDCNGSVPANEADSDGDSYRVCAGDCNDGNPNIHPGASEACNGIDDNCDGSTPANEADADSDGHRICHGDCDDTNADINPDAAEICNEIDDNCDGSTDEGCLCTDGQTQPCGSNVGVCEPGEQTCTAGIWGTCQGGIESTDEACNGLDDDCDGTTPANETDADSDGHRLCQNDCDDENADIHPDATETCNGVDDNCDGVTDEGCPCTDDESRPCEGNSEGACDPGTQHCQTGTWGDCQGVVEPVEESCGDEIDNDCDGQTDEDCGCQEGDRRPCDGESEGACDPGEQLCQDGNWGECQGVVEPTEEVCDDEVDNDCDGHTDEGCESEPERYRITGSCNCGSAARHSWALVSLMLVLLRRRDYNR